MYIKISNWCCWRSDISRFHLIYPGCQVFTGNLQSDLVDFTAGADQQWDRRNACQWLISGRVVGSLQIYSQTPWQYRWEILALHYSLSWVVIQNAFGVTSFYVDIRVHCFLLTKIALVSFFQQFIKVLFISKRNWDLKKLDEENFTEIYSWRDFAANFLFTYKSKLLYE